MGVGLFPRCYGNSVNSSAGGDGDGVKKMMI